MTLNELHKHISPDAAEKLLDKFEKTQLLITMAAKMAEEGSTDSIGTVLSEAANTAQQFRETLCKCMTPPDKKKAAKPPEPKQLKEPEPAAEEL